MRLVKCIPIIICFPFILTNAVAQKLKTVKLMDGVKVSLPKEFSQMTDDDVAQKYPSTKKPLVLYTNPDRIIDFGLNVTKSKFPGNDLELLRGIYKSTFLHMYNKVTFIQDEIKTINKRKFINFEFIAEFEGQRTYSNLMYTLVKDQVFLFNFTCPQPVYQKWQATANAIMPTIKMTLSTPIEVKHEEKAGVKKYVPRKLKKAPAAKSPQPAPPAK